ncbi:ATP-binding protein [Brevibacillus sp. SYSU BS000544]|uniref:ATP-binding protein n=1 Tax=Brevibacillus sp. SYSU BS000544 TaxID=3416443 RepID=UPI003CE519E1
MLDRQTNQSLSRITIITGHYGCGKTELAINLARTSRAAGNQVAIADLDVINPYFRSREMNHVFENEGIIVIAPKGELATSDLPVVSGEIYRYIDDPSFHLIIDVGGDRDGALATGQYAPQLQSHQPDVLFTVNANRPVISHVEGIVENVSKIQKSLRLPITGFVNTTNLGSETTWDDIERGLQVTEAASEQLKIPFLFSCVVSSLANQAKETYPNHDWFEIERYMKLPWE